MKFAFGNSSPGSTRRHFLARAGGGFGLLALAGLLHDSGLLPADAEEVPGDPLAPRPGHFPARAKSVVWLFMSGGPSGIDLFDPKPELQKNAGKRYQGTVDAFFGDSGPLLASPYSFQQFGKSGAWVSEVFPKLAACVDDIAFLKSCHADSNNHGPALLQMHTGMTRPGFPSAGRGVTYGLGSENRNLPGYVVLYDRRGIPGGGPAYWGSGFLPHVYQGTTFNPAGSPILDLARPREVSRAGQRAQLDLLAELNEAHRRQHPAAAALEARMESFELAYRMQMEAPEAMDLTREPEEVKRLYGIDDARSRSFGTQLLLARRLVERGVRFIQVYSGGAGVHWDAHTGLAANHRERAAETDAPIAGLLVDLKRRGLLDSTLLVWGGEFGRLPVSQGRDGRDHNAHGFTMWLAGGGVKGGISQGATDEVGYRAAVDPVSVHDLHATILHQLGIDHKRLTYRHQGRSFRLTDVAGNPVEKILA